MNFESRKPQGILSRLFLGPGAGSEPFSAPATDPEVEMAKAQRREDETVMMRVLLNERINPASKQVAKAAASLIEVAASL